MKTLIITTMVIAVIGVWFIQEQKPRVNLSSQVHYADGTSGPVVDQTR